jgi:hypothetical protein
MKCSLNTKSNSLAPLPVTKLNIYIYAVKIISCKLQVMRHVLTCTKNISYILKHLVIFRIRSNFEASINRFRLMSTKALQ